MAPLTLGISLTSEREDTGQMRTKEILRVRTLALTAAICACLAFGPANAFATTLIIPDSGILTIENQTGALLGITTTPTICFAWGAAPCALAQPITWVSQAGQAFFHHRPPAPSRTAHTQRPCL
jgi:hypothetical protein